MFIDEDIEVTKPCVTIIIPIFNVKEYIEECLKSVEDQTFQDIEVILVNDGSTDGSDIIACKFAEKNKKFKIINQSNGGLSSARNSGLDAAQGEFVYFLDSDDFLQIDAIEKLYTFAKKKNLDLLRFSAYTFEDGTNDYLWSRDGENGGYKYLGQYPEVMSGSAFFEKTIENNDFFPSCCLIFSKREVIEKNKLRFYEGIILEDNLFNFELTNVCERVAIINEPLYYRRYRNGSIMMSDNYLDKIKGLCVCSEETDKFSELHQEIYKRNIRLQIKNNIYRMFFYWEQMPSIVQNSTETRLIFLRAKKLINKYKLLKPSIIVFYLNYPLYRIYRRTYNLLIKKA